MLQFFFVSHGADEVVKANAQSAGPYTDRLKAITAASDLANAEGRAGRAAQVLAENDGSIPQLIWTYGKELYPSAIGKPDSGTSLGSYRMP
jgi:hypothetical protein